VVFFTKLYGVIESLHCDDTVIGIKCNVYDEAKMHQQCIFKECNVS